MPMLGKCANPECCASCRKLGRGKLFAFEAVMTTRPANIKSETSITRTARGPVFFWLCDACCLTLTLQLDSGGQMALQQVREAAPVTILDSWPLDQAG